MYLDADRSDPRPGDLWWLPSSWWPLEGAYVARPAPDAATGMAAKRFTEVADAFEAGRDEWVVFKAKRVTCLIVSPLLDIRDERVYDVVVLRTKSFDSVQPAHATQIREGRRPHAFALTDSPRHGLPERWIDFTSPDSFPKKYLQQDPWRPVCRLDDPTYKRLQEHYAYWLMRDQMGKK